MRLFSRMGIRHLRGCRRRASSSEVVVVGLRVKSGWEIFIIWVFVAGVGVVIIGVIVIVGVGGFFVRVMEEAKDGVTGEHAFKNRFHVSPRLCV